MCYTMVENILFIKFNTPVKLSNQIMIGNNPYIIADSIKEIQSILTKFNNYIESKFIMNISCNSKTPLLDYNNTKIRIEPGAIIRSNVKLDTGAIILMGAVLNSGCSVGKNTMIDMNVVIGSGATIGANCHIGAGAVISGVMEPKSNTPVVIRDNVFIGANCTILPGVEIGENSIIGAGTVITKNVQPNTTAYTKREIEFKSLDTNTKAKVALNEDLRK